MPRMIRAIAVLVLALFTLGVGPASAGNKAKTNLYFTDFYSNGMGGTYYEGAIESGRKSCADGRKVVVIKETTSGKTKIGWTLSEPLGNLGYQWSLESSQPISTGTYYAKVGKTNRCKGAKSNAFMVKEIS